MEPRRGLLGIFGLAANGARSIVSNLSLRNIFGAGAGAAVVAPETTGEFIGSRVTGLFNGLVRGVGRGMLENPLVLATGVTALAVVGANILSRFTR